MNSVPYSYFYYKLISLIHLIGKEKELFVWTYYIGVFMLCTTVKHSQLIYYGQIGDCRHSHLTMDNLTGYLRLFGFFLIQDNCPIWVGDDMSYIANFCMLDVNYRPFVFFIFFPFLRQLLFNQVSNSSLCLFCDHYDFCVCLFIV